jgi:hypothetical protein
LGGVSLKQKQKKKNYLFDTHALIFWVEKEEISPDFIDTGATSCSITMLQRKT